MLYHYGIHTKNSYFIHIPPLSANRALSTATALFSHFSQLVIYVTFIFVTLVNYNYTNVTVQKF